MPTVVVNQNELFQMEQTHSEFNSLDECIEAVNLNKEDLFSVAELLQGQNEPPKKKPKCQDALKS
jgi:hypothetical protein